MLLTRRFANARLDATVLPAEVVRLLENLIRRVFGPAQLDIEIKDRVGSPVRRREWFLVPLPVVDEAVSRIKAAQSRSTSMTRPWRALTGSKLPSVS